VLPTQLADPALSGTDQRSQAQIGKTLAFQITQAISIQRIHTGRPHFLFDIDQLLDLHQKPGIYLGYFEKLLQCHT